MSLARGWSRGPFTAGGDTMSAVVVDREVEQFTTSAHQLFIGGTWVDAVSGETFDTPNPATGEKLASIAAGGPEDIDRAVRAARAAFESGPWSRMTPSERGRLVWKIGDLILEHLEELAQLESLDNGKPLSDRSGCRRSRWLPTCFTTWQVGPPRSKATPLISPSRTPRGPSSTPTPCGSPSVWSARSSPGTSRC